MDVRAREGEAAAEQPIFDFSRLIAPIDLDVFRRDYWEQQRLLLHRDDPDYYADLLTFDDVDRVLSLSSVRSDGLRVVSNGVETPISELVGTGEITSTNALEMLYECYRTGSTIVLNSLQGRWKPLKLLSQKLGKEIGARLAINVYVTPSGNQGFAPHYDTHDVFVAQVHGTKRWRLYGVHTELPLRGQPYDKSNHLDDPHDEFDLQSGDLLYLPRGTVHAATANESASVHLTIGVHPVLWSTIIHEALINVFADDVRFRRSLPIGFSHDGESRRRVETRFGELIDLLSEQLSPSKMLASAIKRAASISAPVLAGHLKDLERLDEISVDTRVMRRPDLRWDIVVDDDQVSLDFHNKTVQLPAFVADEIRYIAESNGQGFTGKGIPGDLDEPSRVILVRTLISEGFLTFA